MSRTPAAPMRLIALEGADGTGKTTQSLLLVDRLQSMGFRATYVRPVFLMLDPWEHGSTKLAEFVSPRTRRLRAGLGGRGHPARPSVVGILARLLGYLYAMAFYGLLRARYRGEEFVVCDRFFYQYFYDLYGPTAVKLARAFPKPNLMVWLDGSVEPLRSRKRDEEVTEERSEYMDSVLKLLRTLARDLNFHRVDARGDVKAQGEAIWRIVMHGVAGCET